MSHKISQMSQPAERARAARPRAGTRRGQTLIIALAVMFVLLLLGAIFVSQVARNLAAAARSRDTSGAEAFAEAGINYLNDQLNNSPDGADWRPVPSGPILTPADPMGLTDPDYRWLSQGFTRITTPGGRYLVRIGYDPHPDDPRSQLIRLESVGRSGEVGTGLDPTIFVQTGHVPQLRRELIAYKEIGLTDFVRWITDIDRRAQESFIGTPAMGASDPASPNFGLDPAIVIGDPSLALHPTGINNNELIIGAPVMVNGSLRLGGDVFFYFSPRGTTAAGGPNTSPESLLVSNNISLLPTRNINNGGAGADAILNDNDLQCFVNVPYDNATASLGGQNPSTSFAIRSSTDSQFSTLGGLVRDGQSGNDPNGFPRGTPRLDPPRFDTFVNGSGVLRY